MRTSVAFIALLVVAIILGTLADRPPTRRQTFAGGYRLLTADLHLHSSVGSDGFLSPFNLVMQAQREGLDVIAVTGHNEVGTSKLAQWMATKLGLITALTGEEIITPSYHLIAVGIDRPISFRLNAADAIDDIHRSRGIAIAAHPNHDYSKGYSASAVAKLDGSEICHPMVYARAEAQRELERFASRAPMAAIGSSDYHGLGRMGSCRTFIFAHDASEESVLEAIRARRTVVFGAGGTAYGAPELVAMVKAAGLQPPFPENRGGWAGFLSRVAGLVGLAGLIWRTYAQ